VIILAKRKKLEQYKASTIRMKARKRGIAVAGKTKAQLIRKMRK
jgi:hypothetical protein